MVQSTSLQQATTICQTESSLLWLSCWLPNSQSVVSGVSGEYPEGHIFVLLPIPTPPAAWRQCLLARSVAAHAVGSMLVLMLASILLLAMVSNQGRELLPVRTVLRLWPPAAPETHRPGWLYAPCSTSPPSLAPQCSATGCSASRSCSSHCLALALLCM